MGGILIVDYYLIRRQQLSVGDLYALQGAYTYTNGFHWRAIVSLVLGIIPNIPGFLVTIGVVCSCAVPAWIVSLYSYAWFVGFFVSGACYRLSFNYKKQVNYVSIDY